MNSFNIILPLQKDINSNSLTGIASTNSIDRDSEKMSKKALQMMVDDINRGGINLFGNHEHQWENTLGAILPTARLVNDEVLINVNLDDPVTNPKIPMLLNKLKKGIRLGLSVGGNVFETKEEYDMNKRKKIKILDGVKIYETSVVGIASNADAFCSIPDAIAKSLKESPKWENMEKCPVCYGEYEISKACPVCFYKDD